MKPTPNRVHRMTPAEQDADPTAKFVFDEPVTVIRVAHSRILAAVSISCASVKVEVGPYSQHSKAVFVYETTRQGRRSRTNRSVIVPMETVPPVCVILRGTNTPQLATSGVAVQGLAHRPAEWQQLHQWAHRISDELSAEFDVAFDWRDHFLHH